MSNLVLKTAPALEPVDIDDAKNHLRVTGTDEDDLIKSYIVAARQRAEAFTQRVFIQQAWYLYFDYCPINRDENFYRLLFRNRLRLPYPPLISLDAFEYLSAASTFTAINSSIYYLDMPGNQIILTDALPEPYQDFSSYRVTYKAGYGTKASDVPEGIRLAIKTLVLHFYENRAAFDQTQQFAMPMAGESLLMPYRKLDYA